MRRLAPLLALSALLLAAPAAPAATIGVVDGQLRYAGEPGESNTGSIALKDGSEYQLLVNAFGEDAVPLTLGPGCRVGEYAGDIRCTKEGVSSIAVTLGDGSDSFNVGDVPVPVTYSGGSGTDRASYFREQAVAVTITVDGQANDGPSGRDNVLDVESLSGSPFADTLALGLAGGQLGGGAGDDRLTGSPVADVIHAAYVESVGTDSGSFYPNGTDTVKCGGGQDFVYADSTDKLDPDCEAFGRDVPGPATGFEFIGSNGPDRISAPYGWEPSVIFGRGGDDLLISGFAGARRIVGGSGNDRIQGGGGYFSPAQRIEGGSGNDRIRARDAGKGFRDVILCGPGRDTAIVDRRDSVSSCERVLRSR